MKGWFDRKQAQRALASDTAWQHNKNSSRALPPGTRHFAEQRICRDMERELSSWLDETCRTIASDLTSYAVGFPRMCGRAARAFRKRNRGGAELGFSAARIGKRLRFSEQVTQANLELPGAGIVARTFRPLAAFSFCSCFVLDRRAMKYLLYCVFRSASSAGTRRASPALRGSRCWSSTMGAWAPPFLSLGKPESPPDVASRPRL